MKTVPFNENARDVWHDASVEVPDDGRNVYAIGRLGGCGIHWRIANNSCWSTSYDVAFWRELPEPPKPRPKIVPHSLAHWHDAKTTRPEEGRKIFPSTTREYGTCFTVTHWRIGTRCSFGHTRWTTHDEEQTSTTKETEGRNHPRVGVPKVRSHAPNYGRNVRVRADDDHPPPRSR